MKGKKEAQEGRFLILAQEKLKTTDDGLKLGLGLRETERPFSGNKLKINEHVRHVPIFWQIMVNHGFVLSR